MITFQNDLLTKIKANFIIFLQFLLVNYLIDFYFIIFYERKTLKF